MKDIILDGYHHSGFLRDLLEAFDKVTRWDRKNLQNFLGFFQLR